MTAAAATDSCETSAAARPSEGASGRPVPPSSASDLLAANINPRTGLATDYLNHFNEAVMLLEMIPDMPECADDFLAWQPLSYAEHFRASNFKAKDLAVAAYEASDPAIRTDFDSITDSMTMILTAVADAMRQVQQDQSRARLAAGAIGWVKPLVMRAGGIINGSHHETSEAEVDQLMTGR